MRRIYALLILVIAILFTEVTYAQTGTLQGKVTDKKTNETLIGAAVVVYQNGSFISGAQTDVNGGYVIKPIAPGTYEVRFISYPYDTSIVRNVQITPDNITFLNAVLSQQGAKTLAVVTVQAKKLIDVGNVSTGTDFSQKTISQMATREVTNVVAQSGGSTQRDQGQSVNINGGRDYAATYYIDGIPIPASGAGTVDVPTSALEDIDVVTGGIPAKYGNATSGIINITTRGPSKQINGGIDLETSQFLDSYGYDLASFSLSGPIIKRFTKSDTLNTSQAKVGFFVAGQIEHAENGSFGRGGNTPPAFPITTVSPSVLANIEQNPLQPSPVGLGFVPTAESLTPADFTTSNYKLDVPSNTYTFAGKLNFNLAKNLQLLVGGNVDYSDYYNYDYTYQLLDPENQGHQTQGTYRAFAKFTQQFSSGTGNNGKSASVFQNAYYSVQIDYSDFIQKFASVTQGSNLFNYGYVGKFQDYSQPTYTYDTANVKGKIYSGWKMGPYEDTLIKFTPGTANPLLTNYTSEYYDLAGSNSKQYYSSLFQIENGGGLINGQFPNAVYSLYANVGTPENAYGYRNFGQYHFAVNGSVDIVNPKVNDKKNKDKGRHAIEFGIEYQEDNQKLYEVFPAGLWGLMRQLTDPSSMTLQNPRAVTDKYGNYQDTIKYTRVDTRADSSQNQFNIQLRKKLGISDTTPIYIDELSPSTFSLNMFTPDELANNGAYYEFYYGYNYLGQNLSSQPKFDDFFTQKDANNNYVRNNPAFTPNYAAAYIQDKFNLGDIVFNAGLRIDRYDDAEQQLKDPYLLYPARTVSEVTTINGQPYSAPSNIGSNYVVYVDNPTTPTKVLGFRNGSQWYLADGTQTSDPNLIAQATQNGTIAPYLVSSTPPVLDGSSFTSFTPVISVMPRVAFSFPISDKVLFFAHYDVLTERPSVLNIGNTLTGDDVTATPWQYYYLKQLTTDYVMTNPALKPEKTIDYQAGYEQQLGDNSAISISMLYRDLQDLVQVQRVVYAYPYDYNTFGNVDFGNVKSLLVSYTLRRTKNISLTLNYTLSFAEGTGSSATSSLSQLSESNPNLQVVTPFSYDQRHTISSIIDYRFPHDNYNGPMIGKTPILRDFGVNLIADAFSGTPYTQQQNVLPTVLEGVAQRAIIAGNINGGRLPWSYRFNLKIDKSFGVNVGHHSKSFPQGRPMSFDVYLLVTNLLNTQNVLSVYAFTGTPSDDGFLESAAGKQYVAEQDYPSSFSNLYQIRVDDPDNFSQPRTIHLGVQIGF